MTFKLLVLSAFLSAADAFTAVAGARPALQSRTASPAMTAPDVVANGIASIPSTLLVADDIDPLFLASSTGGLVFVLLIVGTIIVNFGIMKK